MKTITPLLVILGGLTLSCEGARILAILPTISRSHHIWNHALVAALSERGHHVVALSPFSEKDTPTLRHVILEDSYVKFHSGATLLDRATYSAKQHADAFFECCFDLCSQQLNSNGSKEIQKLKGQFDLLILEAFAFECFFGYVPYFNIPTVAISAHGGYTPWNCQQMGIPELTAVYPLEMFPYTTRMTFWQRTYNAILTLYMHARRTFEHLPRHDRTARKVFGDSMPPLAQIERNFSVFLVNSGPGLDHPRPHPPGVIEVGCLHCRSGKALPQDIQDFLDGAPEGVVFFSLGSNVRSDQMSPEKLQVFLNAFSKLKQRVLWKWESDTLPGQPDNVKLSKWLPQQDILAHPNVRLFLTHGGRLSTQESVYHGVPVLVIPVFYDQYMHGHRAEQMGLGMRLDFNDVSESALTDALNRLLKNNSFLESARSQSRVSRDQPETPLERAVFWTEYVLRHKGAPHLRSAALGLAWYQLYLLDVAAAILVFLVLTVLAVVAVCKKCARTKKNRAGSKKTR